MLEVTHLAGGTRKVPITLKIEVVRASDQTASGR